MEVLRFEGSRVYRFESHSKCSASERRASKMLRTFRADFAKDSFSHVEGNIFENATADVACDHFHRYKEDILLVKQLGANAYRFSISWSRVLPTGSIEGPVFVGGEVFVPVGWRHIQV